MKLRYCPHCKSKNPEYFGYMTAELLGTGLCILFAYFVVTKVVSCHQNNSNQNAEIDACISRGIAYFKEVGAYPTLTTTGENAEAVAKERCNRTTTAFQ